LATFRFDIDPDIARASTISSAFYTDPDVFEASKTRIFERSWQWVGNHDPLRLSDQLWPHTLLPGFLDEPILFSRDRLGGLHCMSNVCTHRGNILVEQACHQPEIRCRYHGRRFQLDGTFVRMPEFEGVENFPAEADHLPNIPFGQWGPFLFAGIRPLAPLAAFIGEMQQRLHWLPLDEFRLAPELSRDYLVKAHWALYCENYLEGFHIPFVHQSLNAAIDYGTYSTELYRYSNLQLGLAKNGEEAFDLPPDSPDYGKCVAAYYYWVFPNLMFNFYPWGLSVNVVKPLDLTHTKVSFITYLWKPDRWGQGAGSELDKVEREDEAIVENVQRGIRSRFYDRGRYSAKRETGTHHFHRLLADYIEK
jgi:choline monooxygenase